jgi:hypothetical protein
LTDTGLAKLLRDYQIRSHTIRSEDAMGDLQIAKGYYLRSFEDAFSRYLPSSGFSTLSPVTNAANAGENEVFEDVTNLICDVSENPGNSSNSGLCNGVTAPEEGKVPEKGKSTVTPFRRSLKIDPP